MQEDITKHYKSVEKANSIVNALFEHLEKHNCDCCKSILKEVFQ